MAVPPFTIDENSPEPTDLVSAFPADSQQFRDVVESWLQFISNPANGFLRANIIEGTPVIQKATSASGDLLYSFQDELGNTQGVVAWGRSTDSMVFAAYADDGTTVRSRIRLNGDTAAVNVDAGVLQVAGVPVDSFATGTRMLFQQTTAPTGWTKDATLNNRALRIVSGTVGSGGSQGFTTILGGAARPTSSVTAGGTVGDTALTEAQIPNHFHGVNINSQASGNLILPLGFNVVGGGVGSVGVSGTSNGPVVRDTTGFGANHTHAVVGNTDSRGGSFGHGHSFTGAAHSHTINMDVLYTDVIVASKN